MTAGVAFQDLYETSFPSIFNPVGESDHFQPNGHVAMVPRIWVKAVSVMAL